MSRSTRITVRSAICVLALSIPSMASGQVDGQVEQLNSDLVAKVLAGAQASDRVLDERDKVQSRLDSKNKAYSDLREKNQPAHAAYAAANGTVWDCRFAVFTSLTDVRAGIKIKRITGAQADPGFADKMQRLQMKYAKLAPQATTKKDSLALEKSAKAEMNELYGTDAPVDFRKDTVAADGKCGKELPLPAVLAHEKRMGAAITEEDSIRVFEIKAVRAGAFASGLGEARYVKLKERTLAVMGTLAGESETKFGDDEMAAVKKRLVEFEKVKRAL